MRIELRWLFLLVAGLLPVTDAAAHGGMFRNPFTTGPVAQPGVGRTPGPRTGNAPVQHGDPTSWQFWWEFNKDEFLRLKDAVHGGRGRVAGDGQTTDRAGFAPTDRERREIVIPALYRLLKKSENRDIQTSCMVALAKMGLDGDELPILDVFRKNLRDGDQEVRETAALCFGISRRRDALDDLLGLALDTKPARRLVGRRSVEMRTRSFAVYGLALLARGRGDSDLKRTVFDALRGLLEDRRLDDRDLLVACQQAVGNLAFDVSKAAEKRLMWQALDVLWTFYERDLGKGDQIVQCHAPVAIARLLGRGHGPDHQRFKKAFAAELTGRQRRHQSLYQSAALALGELVEPREVHAEDAEFADALDRYYVKGRDVQSRYFCLIAMGKIGGDHLRTRLIKIYRDARTALDKPWAALALGLLTHASQADDGGTVDELVGRLLLDDLEEVSNHDARGAIAVALGLNGYEAARPELIKQVADLRRDARWDMLGGYLCVGLSLLGGGDESIPVLREVVDKSVRRPGLLTQAAVSLAILGDKDAVERLGRLMRARSASVATMSSLATAYRFIGDRRAIEPLAKMMFDDGLTKLSRAFVAAALGGVCDRSPLPWNACFAAGTNYRGTVPTLTDYVRGVLDIL